MAKYNIRNPSLPGKEKWGQGGRDMEKGRER
jgi:hypothetical protein